jgi:hypothetical protein
MPSTSAVTLSAAKGLVGLGGPAPRRAANHGPRFVPFAVRPAGGRGRPLPAGEGRGEGVPSDFCLSSRARRGISCLLGGPSSRLALNHGPRSVPSSGPWGARPPRPGLAPASPGRDCSARDQTARAAVGPLAVRSSLRSSRHRHPTAARASGGPLAPQRWAARPRGGLFSPTHPCAARPSPARPCTHSTFDKSDGPGTVGGVRPRRGPGHGATLDGVRRRSSGRSSSLE